MLPQFQNDPFKLTINILKNLTDTKPPEKEQHQLRSSLKPLTEIMNLQSFLQFLLDSNTYQLLSQVFSKLHDLFASKPLEQRSLQSYENLPSSPCRSAHKTKVSLFKSTKKIDLTSSTKKSNSFSKSTVLFLVESLIDNLQKLDQIKSDSKNIKLLVRSIYDEFFISDSKKHQEAVKDINLDIAWIQLSLQTVQKVKKRILPSFPSQTYHSLIQLLKSIQKIYKYMQVLKTTSNELLSLIFLETEEYPNQESHDSSNLQDFSKKSSNPSRQRSLLTEMLRDSSQKSNTEFPQNQGIGQRLSKPRFKEYSQKLAHLDESFKLSYKSAKPYEKPSKLIRCQIDYEQKNDENQDMRKINTKNKQIKIRRHQTSCSKCQIF